MSLHTEFIRIMQQEISLTQTPFTKAQENKILRPTYFKRTAWRINEVARNTTELRVSAKYGHLTKDRIAYESIGSHAHLVEAIADSALDFVYGPEWQGEPYTHREIIEAIRIHDLPENFFGDQPDTEDLDKEVKARQETAYYDKLFSSYVGYDQIFIDHVKSILQEMEEKSTAIGRILYLSDKLAAILMALCYNCRMYFSAAKPTDTYVSDKNREAMAICDEYLVQFAGDNSTLKGKHDHAYLNSELWTIDYFDGIGRGLNAYDEYGFFTALLVMMTLMSRDRWYKWREAKYTE